MGMDDVACSNLITDPINTTTLAIDMNWQIVEPANLLLMKISVQFIWLILSFPVPFETSKEKDLLGETVFLQSNFCVPLFIFFSDCET